MSVKLVSFDVCMALLDVQGSIVPVVAETLVMETAAASNSLGLGLL